MSSHAGFATAVAIDESVLNLVIGVYYDNELVDVSLEKTFPVKVLGLEFGVTFGLTLGKPIVDLSAAQGDRIGIAAALEGSVELQGPLGGVHRYEVVMDLGVLIRPAVEITDGGRIQIGADFSDAELTELTISLPGGGVLKSDHGKVLRSDAVRDVIREFLKKIGTKGFKLSPEILSGTEKLNLALDSVVVRVLNDALVIGVDVRGLTQGQAAALTDFSGASGMAASTNPALIAGVFAGARPNIIRKYASLSIDSLDYILEPDSLFVWGQATKHTPWYMPNVTVQWSARAKVLLTEDKVCVDTSDVTVNLPGWVTVLGVVFGVLSLGSGSPLAATVFAVLAVVGAVLADGLDQALENAADSALAAERTQHIKLPKTTGPLLALHVDAAKLGATGIEMWTSLSTREASSQSALTGTPSVEVTASRPVEVHLHPHPRLYHSADRRVRARWTVTADGGKRPLQEIDRPVREDGALDLSFMHDPAQATTSYTASVRVYRSGRDGLTTELLRRSHEIAVQDRLDRSHPYVRWTHNVKAPRRMTRTRHGQPHTFYVGSFVQERVSKIHRTDLPGRCRFADQFSADKSTRLEYLDALPVPREEILANRALFCDYCFFGGPDKSALRIG